jgi:predicted dithiol-disulfide oxidoreductase (DUF899 family)
MEHCFSAARRRETMTDHKIGTREEWLAARLELLKAEKELTRRSVRRTSFTKQLTNQLLSTIF